MTYDVLVVGAGLAGCTAARILAESGKNILIIEKRDHIGGNCYDYKNELNITIQKYGPHIFHTGSEDVWSFLNRFSTFNGYMHKVISYLNGKFYPIPINKTTVCEFLQLDPGNTVVSDVLKKEVERSKFTFPPENFRDQVVSQVGERLYEAFFGNYTKKQWQKDPENLSADIAKRIPVRDNLDDLYFNDKYQGIPINGFTTLFKNMITCENITVKLDTDYFEVKNKYNPELTIYTGELDRYFDYKYGKLEYRSLEFLYKNVNKEIFQPAAVVNYPSLDVDWTRITEYKQFLSEKSPSTTLCYEYPTNTGEPYYVIINSENLKKRELYMKEANELKDVMFIGRLAEYKYYNMDQVVESVILKLKNAG